MCESHVEPSDYWWHFFFLSLFTRVKAWVLSSGVEVVGGGCWLIKKSVLINIHSCHYVWHSTSLGFWDARNLKSPHPYTTIHWIHPFPRYPHPLTAGACLSRRRTLTVGLSNTLHPWACWLYGPPAITIAPPSLFPTFVADRRIQWGANPVSWQPIPRRRRLLGCAGDSGRGRKKRKKERR